MEDHRSEIMIIFAGYSDEMEKFLQSNPELKSRVPNIFNFEDYSNEEMVEIGLSMLKDSKYEVNEKLYKEILLNNLSLSNDHSNGRWVRNFNESIQKKQVLRLAMQNDMKDVNLSKIEDEDIKEIRLENKS